MPAERDGRAQRSEATRRKLLDAGARLFSVQGYEGTSLDALTAEAGVNKALVRYHFGGKRGLYNAVFLEGVQAGLALLEPVSASGAPAPERLAAFVSALGELFAQRPHFAPLVVREWMTGGAHVEPEVMAQFVRIFGVDREILEAGVRAGELREHDAHATHLALVGSLVFFEITRPVREQRADLSAPPPTPDAFRDVVRSIFLDGLAR